jgi:uncharacterized protein YkwD
VPLSSVERQVLRLVNEQRAAHHLPLLRAQANLMKAARGHTLAMAMVPFFSHISPDGSTPSDRARQAGYTRGFRGWMVGEDIAWGSGKLGTPAQIVRGWMKSAPHRRIILTRSLRDLGIGVATGAFESPGLRLADVTYYTIDLGQRTR